VAARAGCTYEMGRPPDGLVQPMTLMFRLSGVRFRQTGAHQLHEMIQQALATHGGYDINFTQPWVIDLPGYEDQCVVQLTHVRGRSPIDAEDLTMAELEGRRLVWAAFEFLKKCVAEFKTARLVATAPQIGVRESRRITGQRCLTVDDVVNGRKSPEGITRCRFGIDIHQPDGLGQTNIRIKGPYDIPYGCLVPQGVENLLVAGRCICGDHEAMASYRVTGDCVAMGQAAGTAAVLSIADDVPLRLLDVTQLRDSLREQGCAVEGGES